MRAIYSLKLYLFRNQFQLIASELQGITAKALFIALIYVKYWIEAPLTLQAPSNDLQFMQDLETYTIIDAKVGEAAIRKMSQHLWYLSELCIALAFFDYNVSVSEKKLMVDSFKNAESKDGLKKLSAKGIAFTSRKLSDSVTTKTMEFFSILGMDSIFLSTDPTFWQDDETYLRNRVIAESLVVVNDCAERGIGLIKEFNETVTKNEDQRQYLLLVVDAHRKALKECSKKNF